MRDSEQRTLLGDGYELGTMILASRRTRLHDTVARRAGLPPAVAKMGRREMREGVSDEIRSEGALLERVHHPNVARGYGVGDIEELGTYLVREKIRGADLASWLRENGGQPPERTLEIARSLASALHALESGGERMGAVDPMDVWIEEATGRVVLVSVRPALEGETSRRDVCANVIADVLIACGRGRMPSSGRERARARVEIVQARRAGRKAAGVSEAVGPILDLCVVRGAEDGPASAGDLQRRLELLILPEEPEARRAQERCVARAKAIEHLLAVSSELRPSPAELSLPSDLSGLLSSAASVHPSEGSWPDLDLRLAGVEEGLGGALSEMLEARAGALQSEWDGFENAAGGVVPQEAEPAFVDALQAVRDGVETARYGDACASLARAREQIVASREAAQDLAEQRTRRVIDELARELDALESFHPETEIDPCFEPRRVREEAQALFAEGRLDEGVRSAQTALAAVTDVRAKCDEVELRAHARGLADHAVALRRASDPQNEELSQALSRVEQRLGEMVASLGRGDLADARKAFEEVDGDFKRIDWDRDLAARELVGSTVEGLAEAEEVRRTAARLQRGEDGAALRAKLAATLDALEASTEGVWNDAVFQIRELASREAWEALADALRRFCEHLLATVVAPTPSEIEFRPSSELAEVLRVLAEAERDAPPASASDASRLRELRARGEVMLAHLDADRARAVAPGRVDQLVEYCAAAAEAERRGEHARAIRELSAANRVLAELIAATRTSLAEAPQVASVVDENIGLEVPRPTGAEPTPGRPEEQTDRAAEGGAPPGAGRILAEAPADPDRAATTGDAGARAETLDGASSIDPRAAHTVAGKPPRARARGGEIPDAHEDESGWRTATGALDPRAWSGLVFLLLAVVCWTWAPTDWWHVPRITGVGASRGDLRFEGSLGLFPRIGATEPPTASLSSASLPAVLRVSIEGVATGERPTVAWWLGDRVIGRGADVLDLAPIATEAIDSGEPIRVTVGAGTRARQSWVWRIRP